MLENKRKELINKINNEVTAYNALAWAEPGGFFARKLEELLGIIYNYTEEFLTLNPNDEDDQDRIFELEYNLPNAKVLLNKVISSIEFMVVKHALEVLGIVQCGEEDDHTKWLLLYHVEQIISERKVPKLKVGDNIEIIKCSIEVDDKSVEEDEFILKLVEHDAIEVII